MSGTSTIKNAYVKALDNYMEVKKNIFPLIQHNSINPEMAARLVRLLKVNETLIEICQNEINRN